MKAKSISYACVQISLLAVLCSCSDTAQFTETRIPTAGAEPASNSEPSEENALGDPDGDPTLNPLPPEDPSAPESEGEGNGDAPAGPVEETPVVDVPTEPTPPESDPTPGTDPIVEQPVDGGGGGNPTPEPGDLFSDCDQNPNKPIVAKVYQLPVDTAKLPSFTGMTSLADVCVSGLNIANREFTEGFPGVEDLFEWFALDLKFRVTVPSTGTYKFYVNSDDGSILYIDGQEIINNDAQHAQVEKSNTKYLTAGVHNFRVKYFQGPRYSIALELFWKKPNSNDKSYIPLENLSRPQ